MSRKQPRPPANKQQPAQQQSTLAVSHTQQQFSGPIPPPSILADYDALIPGAADRILTIFEAQTNHRHDIELRTTRANVGIARANICERRIGQMLAFIMGLALTAATVYLAMNNHDWVAGILGGTTMLGAITAFMAQRKK